MPLLSGEGADVERRLSTACKRLEWEKRLTVFFRPLDGALPLKPDDALVRMTCTVTGVDKAGIVARVARTIERHGANVVDLKTQARRGAESGTPVFTMQIVMDVPRTADRRVLARELDRVASELAVEIALVEAPTG